MLKLVEIGNFPYNSNILVLFLLFLFFFRHRYYTYVKNSAMLTFVMIFLALILLISVHWQCRMTANENQVCVLDDFIKKIHIGNPPY